MFELIRQLYITFKRVLKVTLGVMPDISPTNQKEARRDVDSIPHEHRFSEYQRIYCDRSLQRGKQAYMLMLLEQQGIPVLLKLKRFIIGLVRAIKPQQHLSTVISIVK